MFSLVNYEEEGLTKVRKKDYAKEEAEFQAAQAEWELNESNKRAWDTMWLRIQAAVFNIVNKRLENVLDHEEIEERALDVTITIMSSIKKKRAANKPWKIEKLSSFCYLPCLQLYNERLKFQDKIKTFSEVLYNQNTHNEFIPEDELTTMINGILCINGVLSDDQ